LFLRWTEKWAKTDMVYLAKGGFWLTIEQIVSSISVFLLAIAFANLLPQETYGIYKYVLSLTSILLITNLPGIGVSVIQATARGIEGSLFLALKTKIYWGFLGSFISLLLSGYYYLNNNISLAIIFIIISLFIPFIDSFGIYGSLLSGRKQFKISSIYNSITQIIATLIIISVIFLSDNIFIILITYLLSNTILRLIFFKITLYKFKPNKQMGSNIISYGKHLSVMGIIGTIATQIDKILIFHYLGGIKLAIYIFATAIPEQIKGFLKNIKALAFPKLSQTPSEDTRSSLKNKIKKMFLYFHL